MSGMAWMAGMLNGMSWMVPWTDLRAPPASRDEWHAMDGWFTDRGLRLGWANRAESDLFDDDGIVIVHKKK